MDLGGLLSPVTSFLGIGGDNSDYSDAAQEYQKRVNQNAQIYNPYIDRGNKSGDLLLNQSDINVKNPNFLQDRISAGFNLSPYYNFILNHTKNMMDYNAASNGMMSNGNYQLRLGDTLQKLIGQFSDNYINRGLDTYKTGINGLSNQNLMGFNSVNNKFNAINDADAAILKGDIMQTNANREDSGGLLGLLGAGAGYFFGGMPGALMGSKILGGGGGTINLYSGGR